MAGGAVLTTEGALVTTDTGMILLSPASGSSGSGGGGSSAGSGSGGTGPTETFSKPAAAIGDVNGVAQKVGQAPTNNVYWNVYGFTETHYYLDAAGDQHTVFYNPTTRQFAGGHLSSGQ